MSLTEPLARLMHLNVAYYGPAMAGKTTNLRYLYDRLPQEKSDWMAAFQNDFYGPGKDLRLIGFHFVLQGLEVDGYRLCFHLSAVPGAVFYDAGRIHLLKNVDGIVFVADAQAQRLDANLEMIENLGEHLGEHGIAIQALPAVMQYNKTDLPTALSDEELQGEVNVHGWPHVRASAAVGGGVLDSLKALAKQLVMAQRNGRLDQKPLQLLKSPTGAMKWWSLFRSPIVG